MDVEITPGAEFRATVAKLRGARPEIKKKLSREIKSATAPIERQMKQNVKDLDSKGVKGGGSNQRRSAREFGISGYKSKRAVKGTGLRDSIAKGVTRKITYSGYRTGVRIRVDGKYLPESQRKLIGATNQGRVRHPVFGNRNKWTTQTFTPKGWFSRPVQELGPEAVRKIREAARKALKSLN